MGALIKEGIWHWSRSDDATPLLDHLSYPAHSFHLSRYLHIRDFHYRAKEGLPPKWSTINPALAVLAPTNSADLKATKTATLTSRKRCINRLWNKSYAFGSNRSKGLSGEAKTNAAKCTLCGAPDDPQHLYIECPGHAADSPQSSQPILAGIRESTFDSLYIKVRSRHYLLTHPLPGAAISSPNSDCLLLTLNLASQNTAGTACSLIKPYNASVALTLIVPFQ